MSRVLFYFINSEKEFNMGFSKIVSKVLKGYFCDPADKRIWVLCTRLRNWNVIE
jgi:hypothetical protein